MVSVQERRYPEDRKSADESHKVGLFSKNLSYIDRLKKIKLPTLKFRRIRGDMIEVHKIINLKYDACTTVFLAVLIKILKREVIKIN